MLFFFQLNNELDWDPKVQPYIGIVVYVGYTIMQIPCGVIADLYGGKYIIGLSILFSAICTLLSPLAAYHSQYTFIAVRFIMGFLSVSAFHM